MGSTSNLLGEFIMGLLRPDKLLVILFQIPAFSGFWSVAQFLCICRQTAYRIDLKFGGCTHYVTLQASWILVFCILIGQEVVVHFTDQMNLKFGRWTYYGAPSQILVMLHWITPVSWPVINAAVSAHLQANCWSDWYQIWHVICPAVSALLQANC